MGIHPMTVRMGLRNERFPFGVAIQTSKQWTYVIIKERFDKWMVGEDMVEAHVESEMGI